MERRLKTSAEVDNLSAHFGSALDGFGYQQPPHNTRGRTPGSAETRTLRDVMDGVEHAHRMQRVQGLPGNPQHQETTNLNKVQGVNKGKGYK